MTPSSLRHLCAFICLFRVVFAQDNLVVPSTQTATSVSARYERARGAWVLSTSDEQDGDEVIFVQVCAKQVGCVVDSGLQGLVECDALQTALGNAEWLLVSQPIGFGCTIDTSGYSTADAYLSNLFHSERPANVLIAYDAVGLAPFLTASQDEFVMEVVIVHVTALATGAFEVHNHFARLQLPDPTLQHASLTAINRCVELGYATPAHAMLKIARLANGFEFCMWTCAPGFMRVPFNSVAVNASAAHGSEERRCVELPASYLAVEFEVQFAVSSALAASANQTDGAIHRLINNITAYFVATSHATVEIVAAGMFLSGSIFDELAWTDFVRQANYARGVDEARNYEFFPLLKQLMQFQAPGRRVETDSALVEVKGIVFIRQISKSPLNIEKYLRQSIADLPTVDREIQRVTPLASESSVWTSVIHRVSVDEHVTDQQPRILLTVVVLSVMILCAVLVFT